MVAESCRGPQRILKVLLRLRVQLVDVSKDVGGQESLVNSLMPVAHSPFVTQLQSSEFRCSVVVEALKFTSIMVPYS